MINKTSDLDNCVGNVSVALKIQLLCYKYFLYLERIHLFYMIITFTRHLFWCCFSLNNCLFFIQFSSFFLLFWQR